MLLVFFSSIAGILSGLISVFFRLREIRFSALYFGRQLVTQIIFLIICLQGGGYFFEFYELEVGILSIHWIWVFIGVNTLGYYIVKNIFEWYTGFELFASEKEVERIIKKLEKKYRDDL